MELDANTVLSDGAEGRPVTDLNKEPDFSAVTSGLFNAATCVVMRRQHRLSHTTEGSTEGLEKSGQGGYYRACSR